MPVKTKTALDQTRLNTVKTTPYLQLDSETEKGTNSEILKAKAVVIIDPATGEALGASDFFKFYEYQAPASTSQANPVSATYYTVLNTQANCRLISVRLRTGNGVAGTVQALTCKVTIDGQTETATVSNPTANTYYYLAWSGNAGIALSTTEYTSYKEFIIEGQSIKVEASVTWTLQPTPLEGYVKYELVQ